MGRTGATTLRKDPRHDRRANYSRSRVGLNFQRRPSHNRISSSAYSPQRRDAWGRRSHKHYRSYNNDDDFMELSDSEVESNDADFVWDEEQTLFSDLMDETKPKSDGSEEWMNILNSLQIAFDEDAIALKKDAAQAFVPAVNRIKHYYRVFDDQDKIYGKGLLMLNATLKEHEIMSITTEDDLKKESGLAQKKIEVLLKQLGETYSRRDKLWMKLHEKLDQNVEPVAQVLKVTPANVEREIAGIEKIRGKSAEKEEGNSTTVISSFLAFTFIHRLIAPVVSNALAPVSYRAIKNTRTRNTWGIHFTSQINVLLLVPLTLSCIKTDTPDSNDHFDRAFGWDDRVGFVNAIACGYFLWDALDATVNFIDTGYVMHGMACFIIYALSFKPFVSYYAVRCLVWEASTFFLNNHWFLDKIGRTGSTLQLANGLCLLLTFICVRIIYGGNISYNFFVTLWHVYDDTPFLYALVYTAGNLLLQGLNWYWLAKMIAALRKRFNGKAPESGTLMNNVDVAARVNGAGCKE
ncbi:hypothetical protein APHAL10511_001008 [Amanita phalloides]|nr:hypothetical protein APHAL10511_001008 [Amanita phalloides]